MHRPLNQCFGSGRAYSRETIVNYLRAQESQPVVASDSFAVTELAAGVALLTYRSAHVGLDKNLANHTLRSSVWIKTGVGWQLRYHQGTAGAQTW